MSEADCGFSGDSPLDRGTRMPEGNSVQGQPGKGVGKGGKNGSKNGNLTPAGRTNEELWGLLMQVCFLLLCLISDPSSWFSGLDD